jgi:A/G-specific adenine glycosylase
LSNNKRYKPIHKKIQEWYKINGRVTLPWRNTESSYEIYLSEIMLQQTQVKTVLERFYSPFLEKFPTFKAVAESSEGDVLKAWEGLGYYTRARNLHKTAQSTQGVLPSNAKELEMLSGIGKSTAHAVACFAFKEPLPILDANVKRILYRFFSITTCSDKILWEKAYKLFDARQSYLYNQAMMDIGSLVCTHRNPNCSECPLETLCQGKETPLEYPKKKVTKKKPTKEHFMIIYSQDSQYGLAKNSTKLLGGLWGFNQTEDFELEDTDKSLGKFTHQYTHFKLKITLILTSKKVDNLSYFTLEEIDSLALSRADRKALEILRKNIE